ncbi:probable G-protein coupled receptor 33 [Rattus rattus]|uniref:Probable G-protein coupled receptor 33 n=1 Tax=Rattus rattus TaxID=10117 RepID=GPR33_RATRT|nr:probable G-protein coupled receptor 33 [Rattus rattus]Q49SP8.1 RecName: Full=Probable G-protein coupled receptor 33 [Rattus rattus]AAR98757.1 G protein-coupled receptor 33 [Rattus rattus]
MDRVNSSGHVISVSPSLTNSTGVPTPAPKAIIAAALFMSFIVGTISNGLYLWMLKFKMQRTVNTLLFFHLILSYFISTLILPFMATSFLQDNHWAFGSVLCKVFNSTLSVSMFASVFFLSAISVDRYHLTLHPVWSQQHRTPRWASRIALRIWILATILSIPYLVFRETHDDHKGRIKCQNNYIVGTNWESSEHQTLGQWIHAACFGRRFLLGFLLPFLVIVFCYKRVATKMKDKGLFKSSKPFKVMLTAVVSFFVCWMPYHVHSGLVLTKSQPLPSQLTLGLAVVTISFNTVVSPILYLFTGENFEVFKKSILALFKSTFSDSSATERTQTLNSETEI